MAADRGSGARSFVRAYFGLQAVGGGLWWVAVFASADVRQWTLGQWDPAVLVVPDALLFVGASAWAALTGNRVAAAIAAVWTAGVTVALTVYGLVSQHAGWGVVLMALATVGSLAAAATIWWGYVPTGWLFVGPFRFRVASDAADAHHIRRSLAQLVVFWTTFFVIVPVVLLTVEQRLGVQWPALDRTGVRTAGVVLLLLGSALGLSSCLTMARLGHGTPLPAETARDLVIAGPYRRVRNPMALAGMVQTAAVGLIIGSWCVVVIAVAGAVVWNQLIRPTEEADLAARFGEPYRRYAAQVGCWIPGRRSIVG